MSRFAPHILLAAIGVMQVRSGRLACYATGSMLLAALAVSIAAIYAQVTVGDVVDCALYGRRVARARVVVRFFLALVTSGPAVWLICRSSGKGGFDLRADRHLNCCRVVAIATIGISLPREPRKIAPAFDVSRGASRSGSHRLRSPAIMLSVNSQVRRTLEKIRSEMARARPISSVHLFLEAGGELSPEYFRT